MKKHVYFFRLPTEVKGKWITVIVDENEKLYKNG